MGEQREVSAQDLEKLAAQLGQALSARGFKIATAESCTGGELGALLTTLSGSSAWFECGWVTYSNASKIELLDVPEETLLNKGAVSEETALAMARGALKKSKAHVSLAITGIAGPCGGTLEKPIGTVWIASASLLGFESACLYHFPGTRAEIRRHAVIAALELVLDLSRV